MVAVYNSTVVGPQYNAAFLVGGPIALLFSGGGFSNVNDPSLEFQCRTNRQQLPTLIEFLGEQSQVSTTSDIITSGRPLCKVACIGDNNKVCQSNAPPPPQTKGVSNGTFWTTTVLLSVYGVVITAILVVLVLRMRRGAEYSILN
jgi:hypothetical protein